MRAEVIMLDEIIASLDSFEDERTIFACHPWTAESPAIVGRVAAGALEPFCRVAEAKEKLRAYEGDPVAMRLARAVAFAESLRVSRRFDDREARYFYFEGKRVGCFEPCVPTAPGRYAYTIDRCQGSRRFGKELRAGRRVQCSLRHGITFVAVGAAGRGIEIESIERKRG
jgi:hypothetical protein